MPAPPARFRRFARLPLRLALAGALLGSTPAAVVAQAPALQPDSVVAPAPVDPVRSAAVPVPPEPAPDAEPTPGPVSRRARWTIIGTCALLTLSTLLLYNVRSR